MSLIPGHRTGVWKNPTCAIYEANIEVRTVWEVDEKKCLIKPDVPLNNFKCDIIEYAHAKII